MLTDCPAGFREPSNGNGTGVCYCTKEDVALFGKVCDVECVKIVHGVRPPGGRCHCPGITAGLRCDRNICHYSPSAYYDESYYQLFCLDNYNNDTSVASGQARAENCTGIMNLGNRTPKAFPECPCLNDGRRIEGSMNTTCVCTKGYYGELCHMQSTYDRPSPWGTIGVAAFIVAVFAIIGLALWYRKQSRKKYYATMYQLEPVTMEVFDHPTATPPPSRRRRRQTLADILSGTASRIRRKKSRQAKGPTVFEGVDENKDQPTSAGAYDEQFGNAPQNYTSGMGM